MEMWDFNGVRGWNDANCHGHRKAICETDADFVPDPPSNNSCSCPFTSNALFVEDSFKIHGVENCWKFCQLIPGCKVKQILRLKDGLGLS